MIFEKTISLGNVLVMLTMVSTIVYGYAVLGSTVADHERKLEALHKWKDESADLRIGLVRLEEKTSYIAEQVTQINNAVEKLQAQ